MSRRLLPLILLLAGPALAAGPLSIPETLKRAKPGIKPETHAQCLEWWEDWAAQNRGELEKLDTLEQHCAFVMYVNECGGWLHDYELPGSPPGSGVPSFTDYPHWDDAMTEDWREQCFEFTDPESDSMKGTVKGLTKRLERLIYQGDGTPMEHIKRRLKPLRKRAQVVLPLTGRASKREVFRRTGTR